MTANQKASTTMMWLKQLTTTTFSTITGRIDRIEYVRRNKKSIAIAVLSWVLLVITGFFALNLWSNSNIEEYYKSTSVTVNELAGESGAILLEGELLGLSRIVAEFTDEQSALFTAILDHENKVMAHSDPEKLNTIFVPPVKATPIKMIEEVSIAAEKLADGSDATTFTRIITFSGVEIGRVVVGIPESKVLALTAGASMNKTIWLVVATVAAGAVLAFAGRKRSKPVEPGVKDEVEAMDGSTIGPYRLGERIAQGGMAELYKADYVRQDGFRRTMAVKRVLPHLAQNQDFIDMFIREARLAAILQHPNIVQIFDFGKIMNAYFIAMEYIDGLNLGQIMAHLKSGLPVDMTVFLGTKISLGLDYSHKRKNDDSGEPLGIVHRDISPQNILVSRQGEVKISDFGISKANTEPSLTQAGVIKGKLGYLSPEQALGQDVNHQCDIYALGLVLYEILTASRVYQFDSEIDAINMIPKKVITPLNQVRPDLPDGLNDIVMKCLAKDKAERYQDAKQLHADLVKLKSRLNIAYDATDLSNFMSNTFEDT